MHHRKHDGKNCQFGVTDSNAARLVALCADQIVLAITEARDEVDSLSFAVLDSARHAAALSAALTASDEQDRAAQALQNSVRSANTHLQFADRLEQRLSNVSKNLKNLAQLMQSIDLPITDAEWRACLIASRATFTMEQERQMFDAIFDTSASAAHTNTDESPEPVVFDGDTESER